MAREDSAMPRQHYLLLVPLLVLALAGTIAFVPGNQLDDPTLDKYALECGDRQGVLVERVLWNAGAYPVTGLWAGYMYIDWKEAAYNSKWYVPVLVDNSGISAFGEQLPPGPVHAVVQPRPAYSILDIAPTACRPLGLGGDFEGRALYPGNASQVIVLYIDALGWHRYHEFRPLMPNLSSLGEPIAATAVYPSISRVNSAAMATGVSPERSGVDRWENRTLLVPDAVGSARRQNVSAAWVDGPSPPVSLPAGTLSVRDANGDGTTDEEVTARALAEHVNGTRLLYVHLLDMDRTLHATGPYSAASRDAAVKTDALAGRLIGGAKPGTLIIVTADHGGHDIAGGRGDHGSLLPDDMLVPIYVHVI